MCVSFEAYHSKEKDMSQIPISICLKEGIESRRGYYPYLTYAKESFASVEEGHEDPFLLYLLSEDNRLPMHPLVKGLAAKDEDYETYVGDKEWEKGLEQSKKEEEQITDPLPYNDAVNWITHAVEYLTSVEPSGAGQYKDTPPPPSASQVSLCGQYSVPTYTGAGAYSVVLAGKYCIADDCSWAVSSRCPQVQSTRDVLLLMKSSLKFGRDLQRQREEVKEGRATMIEFSLIRAVGNGGADEWRVFIPCRVVPHRAISSGDAHCPALCKAVALKEGMMDIVPLTSFTAVTQRATDVCFPALSTWNAKEQCEHHQLLVSRVLQANLLERWHQAPIKGRKKSQCCSSFESTLDAYFELLDSRMQEVKGEKAKNHNPITWDELILFFAVDVVWESSTLPVYVLSGQVHLFVADASVKKNGAAVQNIVPYLKNEDDESVKLEDQSNQLPTFKPLVKPSEGRKVCLNTLQNRGDGSGFWRLLRSSQHWNEYVKNVEKGRKDCEENHSSGSSAYPYFCIFATEAEDLLTAAERREEPCRSGLPVEFLHPELLHGNKEALKLFEWWKEKIETEKKE